MQGFGGAAGGSDVSRLKLDADRARAGAGGDQQRNVTEARAEIDERIGSREPRCAEQREDMARGRGLIEDLLRVGRGFGAVRFGKAKTPASSSSRWS